MSISAPLSPDAFGSYPRELLLIDDDQQLVASLARYLAVRGFHVTRSSPRQVLAQLDTGRLQTPDLIVTELVFSDVDGLALIAGLHAYLQTPILVHSASQRVGDAAAALVLGADSFVRKPCEPEELAERASALLRRSASAARQPGPHAESRAITVGNLTLEATRGRATLEGVPIHLTPTEFRVLLALAGSPSQVVLHDQLAQRVWSYPNASTAPSVSIHIRSLRAKLRGESSNAPRIATVKGVGYSLIPT